MSSQDKDVKLVQEHVDALAEHFDSVQIFVTRHESGSEGGTVSVNLGAGDWFARYGKAKLWVVKHEVEESSHHPPDAPTG